GQRQVGRALQVRYARAKLHKFTGLRGGHSLMVVSDGSRGAGFAALVTNRMPAQEFHRGRLHDAPRSARRATNLRRMADSWALRTTFTSACSSRGGHQGMPMA